MTNLLEHLHHSSYHNIASNYKKSGGLNEEHSEHKDVIPEVVKFTIMGLLASAEFQKCKYIIEGLRRCYPEKYEEPVIKPMMNLDWNDFVTNERRSRGGTFWALKKSVVVYYNDDFMGDDIHLAKYVSTRYILPMKNFHCAGRVALKNYFTELMSNGRSCIYLMISIDDVVIGTMLFVLYDDLVPKTCRLFMKRCRKLKGGYTGTPIHRIVQPSWIQCGGYALKEVKMPCENYAVSHDKRGVLSMCNSGKHKKNTTQFLITLEKSTWMDTHYVAFGQLLQGDWILSQIEAVPTNYQAPRKDVRITRAGEYSIHPPKLDEGKLEYELQEFLDKRLRRKTYQNYYTKDELNLEKTIRKNEGKRDYLDSDLRSYFPMQMLPENILEAFNYLSDKKSSCLFEVENCTKCGCSHDAGKCIGESLSRSSYSS